MHEKLNQESLAHCVSAATTLATCYTAQYNTEFPRSVDNFLEACRKYLDKPINVSQSKGEKEKELIWGAIATYPDRYEIVYVNGLNYCWKRFVVCKEAFHAVLDGTKHRNMKLSEHIKEMTGIFNMPTLAVPSESSTAEFTAEIAAMEFLFPYKHRIAESRGPNKDKYQAIADKFRVPLKYVELYMSPRMMDALANYSPNPVVAA